MPGEEPAEGFDNLSADVPFDGLQGHGGWLARELRLLPERYASRDIELHVHFRGGFASGRGIRRNFCAVFRRTDMNTEVRRERWGIGEVGSANASVKRGVGEAMLVQIRKPVELPEGRTRILLLPSEVRLQLLDDCLRVWVDAPNHLSAFTGLEGPRPEDGKRQILSPVFGQGVNPGVGDGKFVDEGVEGGMEVVEAITNDEAKSGGGAWRTSK